MKNKMVLKGRGSAYYTHLELVHEKSPTTLVQMFERPRGPKDISGTSYGVLRTA